MKEKKKRFVCLWCLMIVIISKGWRYIIEGVCGRLSLSLILRELKILEVLFSCNWEKELSCWIDFGTASIVNHVEGPLFVSWTRSKGLTLLVARHPIRHSRYISPWPKDYLFPSPSVGIPSKALYHHNSLLS